MLKLLDLFSGIGGFSLGLERTGGFETVAFCEIDKFCHKVLRKHWPHVRQYQDVTKLTADQLKSDGITVDAICGGFPCQDISTAGGGAGMGEGTRSGLWSEYARLIGELRPRYAIVENVSALLGRGLDRVLGDLAQIGYDAEWHCIPASSVGAPHRRDRIWIVAYPQSLRHINGREERNIFNSDGRQNGSVRSEFASTSQQSQDLAHADNLRKLQPQGRKQNQRGWLGNSSWWDVEPNVGRVANGVPNRVDRLKSLGNAVVPQIPELIGRAILNSIGA
jgi:DNA (cytosine-5)-methyltransferase 1